MSLRARLLIGLVALFAIGLGVAAVVTYEEQRSFLLTKVGQEVGNSRGPVSVSLGLVNPGVSQPRRGGPRATSSRPPNTFQASGTYGVLLDASGKVLRSHSFTFDQSAPSPPALPGKLPVSSFRAAQFRLFTVNSKAGSGLRYRVAAFAMSGGRVLVIAVPLKDVDQTLQRLVLVELLVGAAVILAIIALGWGVIRVGLRPLERMGRVASEIAGGDLTRRVSPDDTRTEVGRLGSSLNQMLAQIEQAFEARSESENRLRRFLSDASHELRTPLASIRGYAEVFRLGAATEPEELERAMTRIEAEAARMGVLVENLLLLARLDELPEMRLAAVDLRELAEHAAQDMRAVAPEREVTLTAEDPMPVLADAEQLRQLLANLTRNAVIHTPPATAIEITLRREGASAVLEVRDHGPGLPADAGDRVFERFWRTEGGRSRGRGGSGLGLAIVKAIVQAHHGEVHAGNAPGGGAVFRVTLPIMESGHQPGRPEEPAARA
ncbi:MAG TPA: HAMP domain-containing sensor histidine kinase [Solirubrobacteraceae bacterium]|nr:HAMP domain-containing sensor histidine kinase [Solirubrobacteraceae bacterium]